MTSYRFKKRNIDRDAADDGQWFDIVDFDGTDFGKFKLRSMSSTAYKAASIREQKRLPREKRILLQSGSEAALKLAHEIDVKVFVEAVLVDWKVEDEDGKAIPYSPDAAQAWFTEDEGIFTIVESVADNIRNFRKQEQEEVSGNSGAASNGKGSSKTATLKSSETSQEDAA